MSAPLADKLARAREVIAKATPGPLGAAGGYLTARNPEGVSFSRSIFHLREIGQDRGSSPFQAIPFARREDAAKAALAWNALPALLDAVEALRTAVAYMENGDFSNGVTEYGQDEGRSLWIKDVSAVHAALARLSEVLP